MVLLDYVTQSWWFQYHITSGWFVDSISEEAAIRRIKEGWPLTADDIGAVNASVVEAYIINRRI